MIFVPYTVNPCEVTVHMQEKKKKKRKKEENVKVKTCRRIHHYPNGHNISRVRNGSLQKKKKKGVNHRMALL